MTYVQKESQKTISSENEIEKWYLRQSAKTVALSKPVKYDEQRFFYFDESRGVESIAVSTLYRSIEKK